jgi:DNA-directed RNA polymerase subunit RPC12/RpoP
MALIFYRCAKCKREYSKLEDAESCEAGHLTVVAAKVKGYGIHQYPYEVAVTFSNGETRTYLAENLN